MLKTKLRYAVFITAIAYWSFSATAAVLAPEVRATVEALVNSNSRVQLQLREGRLPIYPSAARARDVSAEVTARFKVFPDGHVDQIQIKPGTDEALAEEVAAAIRTWSFLPTGLQDPAPVYVRYKFVLD